MEKTKFYVHPVDMTHAYIDQRPYRDAALALSPLPDSVGPFLTEADAHNWCEKFPLSVVDKPAHS